MTLNAYVKHKFDKGFLLRDEDLTKLLDFVKVRAAEVNAADRIKIKVYRSDSLVYESPSLEPLRAEENALRNRLTRVQVLLDHTELKVNFDFDAEENISIEIESTDRDRAYLLFSELKEYLNTEVLVLRKRASREDRLFLAVFPMACLMLIMGFTVFLSSSSSLGPGGLKTLQAGDDMQAKLNYLIAAQTKTTEMKSLAWLLPLLV